MAPTRTVEFRSGPRGGAFAMIAPGTKRLGTMAVATGIVLAVTAWSHGGDEPPNRLGRIFRLGGSPKSAPPVGKAANGPKKPGAPGTSPDELPAPSPFQPTPAGSSTSLPPYGALPATNP